MKKSVMTNLPSGVIPVNYKLTLEPDLNSFTFKGIEVVTIEISRPTDLIVLNCIEIDVTGCSIVDAGGQGQSVECIDYDIDKETVMLNFANELPSGPAELTLHFKGALNDKLRGFYRSKYTDNDGLEKYLATTQLEATDARRAFPCWDEPNIKATFDVELVIPSELQAVSNMPVNAEEQLKTGLKRVCFETTPIMSTYLLAFVVGELESIEKVDDGGTLHRVWTTTGKSSQGEYALAISVELLKYLNKYFGIPYPLPKLDHLAIPDFAAGAMENWGAITYRENALLVDPENSSAATKQRVATIIAHEMAHMWFGDLVTMAWWNDLWLNESFASWMGDKAVDHIYPEWEMWTQFITEDTNRGLSLDGLKNSHPIEQEVKNPAEIGQLFDAVSYSKGGAILRMLEQFLGEEQFRTGLNLYMNRHTYGNATTSDLWKAMEDESNVPVASIMDSWVQQIGYPVIDARVSRETKSIKLEISQQRFVYENIMQSETSDKTLWQIPLGIRLQNDSQTHMNLIKDESNFINIDIGQEDSVEQWIKVNALQTGFFRVKYSPEEQTRLLDPIKNQMLPAADRLGLQNDAFALMRSGHISATEFLSVAEAYTNETNASVCEDLAANLSTFDYLIWNEPYYPVFQEFALKIFDALAEKVGWESEPDEGHLDALLRTTVLMEAGSYGSELILQGAKSRFDQYTESVNSVHPDIRSVVFGLAAQMGDRSTYDTMWDLHNKSTLQEEKVRFLSSLGKFQSKELLTETLERSLSSEVRIHNTVPMVASVAMNRYGMDLAWDFVKKNWDEFNRRYGEGGFTLMHLVSITSRFTTMEKYEDVERFFSDNPSPAADRTIKQALERISLNAAWLERNRQELVLWLK
ncbi:MAG: M1 family metallopeptidase [Chloroflexota bacterium]|nr:M1 family metallopeptidase [Chloroflexota bacterium]